MTSISKLSNFTYLSVAFQLNDMCVRAGLPFLCLCLLQAVCICNWPGPCLDSHLVDYCMDSFRFCHFSLDLYFSVLLVFVCLCWSDHVGLVWDFYSLHDVILLASNVIKTDVA